MFLRSCTSLVMLKRCQLFHSNLVCRAAQRSTALQPLLADTIILIPCVHTARIIAKRRQVQLQRLKEHGRPRQAMTRSTAGVSCFNAMTTRHMQHLTTRHTQHLTTRHMQYFWIDDNTHEWPAPPTCQRPLHSRAKAPPASIHRRSAGAQARPLSVLGW